MHALHYITLQYSAVQCSTVHTYIIYIHMYICSHLIDRLSFHGSTPVQVSSELFPVQRISMSKIYWIHWENPWKIYMKSGFLFQIDWAFWPNPFRGRSRRGVPIRSNWPSTAAPTSKNCRRMGAIHAVHCRTSKWSHWVPSKKARTMGRVFFGDSLSRLRYFLGSQKIYLSSHIQETYIYINLKREIDDKPWNFGVGMAFLEHFDANHLQPMACEENALITVTGIVMNCEMPTPVACRNSTQRNRPVAPWDFGHCTWVRVTFRMGGSKMTTGNDKYPLVI